MPLKSGSWADQGMADGKAARTAQTPFPGGREWIPMSRKGKSLRPEVARQVFASGLWTLAITGPSGVAVVNRQMRASTAYFRRASAAFLSCCGWEGHSTGLTQSIPKHFLFHGAPLTRLA